MNIFLKLEENIIKIILEELIMKAIAKKTISVRDKIRIISYAVAVVVVLAGFAISGYVLANRYKQNLEYTYMRALNELSDYVSNIEVSLQKGVYANTSTQQQNVCMKLMSQSIGAKNALEQLPVNYANLENVSKFISQVGDFASYVSTGISKGNGISDKERDNIRDLYKYAKSVNLDIQDISARFGDGEMSIGDSLNDYYGQSGNTNVESMSFINSGFKDINDSFVDYPTMIYDGPFSDHIARMTSRYLEGMYDISSDDAQTTAAEFMGVDKGSLEFVGEINDNMPVYKFQNENFEISITKAGGYISYFLGNKDVREEKLGFDEANQKALEFLAKNQITGLKESFYEIQNGICTINYAYFKDGIIYYPDLIKVSVALDDGSVVSMDATGFMMNHTNRQIPTKTISKQEASGKISKNLKINKVNKALIPTSGLNEVFCYEFDCTGENDDKVLVYINAQTGLEEHIYIVISSNTGVMAM